jgi:hypothetical protein
MVDLGPTAEKIVGRATPASAAMSSIDVPDTPGGEQPVRGGADERVRPHVNRGPEGLTPTMAQIILTSLFY